jgi:HEAT repeat protein
MRKRVRITLAVLLVAVAGGVAWQALRQPRQPVYDGKPMRYWMAQHLGPIWVTDDILPGDSVDPSSPHVHVWVRQLLSDSNAVPFLVGALKRDSWVGAGVYRKWLWPKLPAAAKRHLPQPFGDYNARAHAAMLLGGMGPLAKPAIPALVRMLKEGDEYSAGSWAVEALGRLGQGDEAVVAALSNVLTDKNFFVRRSATNALLTLAPETALQMRVSVPALIQTLKGSVDDNVRMQAAWTLTILGKGNRSAIAALTDALKDKNPRTRVLAARALDGMGVEKGDMAATTALVEALGDKNVWVREWATNALRKINPEAAAKAGVN